MRRSSHTHKFNAKRGQHLGFDSKKKFADDNKKLSTDSKSNTSFDMRNQKRMFAGQDEKSKKNRKQINKPVIGNRAGLSSPTEEKTKERNMDGEQSYRTKQNNEIFAVQKTHIKRSLLDYEIENATKGRDNIDLEGSYQTVEKPRIGKRSDQTDEGYETHRIAMRDKRREQLMQREPVIKPRIGKGFKSPTILEDRSKTEKFSPNTKSGQLQREPIVKPRLGRKFNAPYDDLEQKTKRQTLLNQTKAQATDNARRENYALKPRLGKNFEATTNYKDDFNKRKSGLLPIQRRGKEESRTKNFEREPVFKPRLGKGYISSMKDDSKSMMLSKQDIFKKKEKSVESTGSVLKPRLGRAFDRPVGFQQGSDTPMRRITQVQQPLKKQRYNDSKPDKIKETSAPIWSTPATPTRFTPATPTRSTIPASTRSQPPLTTRSPVLTPTRSPAAASIVPLGPLINDGLKKPPSAPPLHKWEDMDQVIEKRQSIRSAPKPSARQTPQPEPLKRQIEPALIRKPDKETERSSTRETKPLLAKTSQFERFQREKIPSKEFRNIPSVVQGQMFKEELKSPTFPTQDNRQWGEVGLDISKSKTEREKSFVLQKEPLKSRKEKAKTSQMSETPMKTTTAEKQQNSFSKPPQTAHGKTAQPMQINTAVQKLKDFDVEQMARGTEYFNHKDKGPKGKQPTTKEIIQDPKRDGQAINFEETDLRHKTKQSFDIENSEDADTISFVFVSDPEYKRMKSVVTVLTQPTEKSFITTPLVKKVDCDHLKIVKTDSRSCLRPRRYPSEIGLKKNGEYVQSDREKELFYKGFINIFMDIGTQNRILNKLKKKTQKIQTSNCASDSLKSKMKSLEFCMTREKERMDCYMKKMQDFLDASPFGPWNNFPVVANHRDEHIPSELTSTMNEAIVNTYLGDTNVKIK